MSGTDPRREAPSGSRWALVTGFEPFAAHTENVSEQVARALDGETVGAARVQALVLTVDEAGSRDALRRLEPSPQRPSAPSAVLMLGLAHTAHRPRAERRAYNWFDMRIADNAGRQVDGQPIAPGAPEQLCTSTPEWVFDALEAEGWADRSDDPGRFVCNETYFRVLRALSSPDGSPRAEPPALFLHLPPPSRWPLDQARRAARRALELMLQRPA